MKHKHKILIIDDEPNILRSFERAFQEDDREIFLAEDTEEADRIIEQEKDIEVVICDNRLPDKLGVDFLAELKDKYPDTVRILITGYPDLTGAMTAINKANIWRYIMKPVDMEEMKVILIQAIDYYRVLRENRVLLNIARQQAEWLKILQERYPHIINKEVDKSSLYIIDEKRVSEAIKEFLDKYYPSDK